jgi:PAS domain S-box-containing protein
MATRFLCTTEHVPPGFEKKRPAKSDLLRGTIVLFVSGPEEGRALLRGYEDRVRGILITQGDHVLCARMGPMCWHLTVVSAFVPHLRGLVEGLVEAIALGESHYEHNVVLTKEVERLRDVLVTTRDHYNVVTDRLREKVEQVSQLNANVRESEQDLAITLDSIGDAVLATDADGHVRRMNPVAEELTGWPRSEAIGRPLGDVFHIVDTRTREPLADLVARVHAGDEIARAPGQTSLVGRGGVERLVAHSVAPIRSADGVRIGVVVVFRDVTEQVRREEQLRQGQRMDALGQLAGGVAHDFNNILGGIMGFSDLLRRRVGRDDAAMRYADAITKAAERAAGLTRQLLAFARKTQAEMRTVNVHDIVHDALDLASRAFDRRIEVETRLEAEPSAIVAEPSLVQTVLLNLLLNARDAMPQGGRIVVSTTVVRLDVDEARSLSRGMAAGDHVVVTVEDSGEGVPKEILPRIFEPFFTTKAPDKGTGLGLAAVYGIMHDHHGGVVVASEVGRGTTFRLFFPFPTEREVPIEAHASAFPSGAGRVLIVEDDAMVRVPMVEGLSDLGYTVTAACDGAEAVALVTAQPTAFDVVLMDMNMPAMHGKDAVVAIRKQTPDVPVIVLSGYLPDAQVEEILRLGPTTFLQKPCRLADLSRHVAKAIQSTSS